MAIVWTHPTRPAGCLRHDTAKTQPAEIKFIDKHINDANRVVFAYPIFQLIRKQCALALVRTFNKTLHRKTPLMSWTDSIRHQENKTFLHSLDPKETIF